LEDRKGHTIALQQITWVNRLDSPGILQAQTTFIFLCMLPADPAEQRAKKPDVTGDL